MTRWLVTGANGMLGTDLVHVLRAAEDEVTELSHQHLDITDRAAVESAVPGHDVVANLAAWTDVDGAETAESQAWLVNAAGPENLARACAATGARLIQLSTDYVFDGTATTPYDESAPTHPVNAYGRTKLAGELAVLDLLPQAAYVLRTAWLYGAHGPNFVATMARLSREQENVDVVDDQRGQPTWTRDVALRMVELMAGGAPPGIYHATSSGQTTWFGLARAVFVELGLDPERVRPVPSSSYNRPAVRPDYSVLGHDGWRQTGLSPMRGWREALAAAGPSVLRQSDRSS